VTAVAIANDILSIIGNQPVAFEICGFNSGWGKRDDDDETVYYGRIVRIPAEVFTQHGHGQLGPHEQILMDRLAGEFPPIDDVEPVPGGTREVFMTFDAVSGEGMVLVRVPYRKKTLVAVTGDAEVSPQFEPDLAIG
jgi:hypothetical protein